MEHKPSKEQAVDNQKKNKILQKQDDASAHVKYCFEKSKKGIVGKK